MDLVLSEGMERAKDDNRVFPVVSSFYNLDVGSIFIQALNEINRA